MAIHSSLTTGVRRAGENIKSQNTNSCIKKGNYQRNNDSEATSSTNASSYSTDRYSGGMEGGIRRKKTIEKSNLNKGNGFRSFRLSSRRPKSPATSLPDDGSASIPTLQSSPAELSNPSSDRFPKKPAQNITRSGSLKISRNKNMLPSESKKSPNSKKSTFSSILKDVKFPEREERPVTVKEVLSVAKLCPYNHCSLHDHHHHHGPPPERFAYLKRRSSNSNDEKSLKPQTQPTEVSKKGGKGNKDEDADFSKEFYAKTTTSDHLPEPEAETISLRRRTAGEKKNSDEWMVDYALQQVVGKLAPTQKRKVALLVKAFETVGTRLQ